MNQNKSPSCKNGLNWVLCSQRYACPAMRLSQEFGTPRTSAPGFNCVSMYAPVCAELPVVYLLVNMYPYAIRLFSRQTVTELVPCQVIQLYAVAP